MEAPAEDRCDVDRPSYSEQKAKLFASFEGVILSDESPLDDVKDLSSTSFEWLDASLPSSPANLNLYDVVIRSFLLTLLSKLGDEEFSPSQEMSSSVRHVERLLKLLGWLVSHKRINFGRVFPLLEDLFECLSCEKAAYWFRWIEANCSWIPTLASDISEKETGPLVRCFQTLLKRLNKSEDSVLCGQILSYISFVIPLSHPSGYNKKGKLNLSNVTKYENNLEGDAPMLSSMIMEEETKKVDAAFYSRFWKLVDFVHNNSGDPSVRDVKQLEALSSHFCEVLKVFELTASKVQEYFGPSPGKRNHADRSIKASIQSVYAGEDVRLFPKYLTNPKLLQLEILDPVFRKYVLVQFYLFLHSLRRTSTVQVFPDADKQSSDQNQALSSNRQREAFASELTETQEEIVRKLMARVQNLLQRIPPDSAAFSASLEELTKHEELWIEWKRNKCTLFERPVQINTKKDDCPYYEVLGIETPSSMAPSLEALHRLSLYNKRTRSDRGVVCDDESGLGDLRRPMKEQIALGSQDLFNLWNETPTAFGGSFTLREYVECQEGAFIEENKQLSWKIRRIICKENLDFYEKVISSTPSIDTYLAILLGDSAVYLD